MSILYDSEEIVGVVNILVLGNGIVSTMAEPKRLRNIIITVSARAGNRIEGWVEREQCLDITDRNLPLVTDAYRIILPINFEIQIGRRWRAGIRSGSTPTNIYVTYEYELI